MVFVPAQKLSCLVSTKPQAPFTEARCISHVPNLLLTRKSLVLAHAVRVKCDVWTKILMVCFIIYSFFRAHLNDLENIPIFLIIALMFMLANLSPTRGIWCLRIFTAARILHTIVYLNAILIPRVLCFVTGSVCIVVLGISVLLFVARAGVS